MIHLGLNDIGFLYKKNVRIPSEREQAERMTLIPEEEHKAK
jgi:hypothetical protein